MRRRDFLRHAGLLAGTAPALGALAPTIRSRRAGTVDHERPRPFDPTSWSDVRDQFALTRSHIHMASFLLASHPRPVAEAIERHRKGFDKDPATYWGEHFRSAEPNVRAAIGTYLGADPAHIALTDSTTMGLGLVYGGLALRPGQEILTTPHGHWSTLESLNLRAKRTGAKVNTVALYDDPAETSVDMVVSRMRGAITDQTRVLAVTWVHSSTGVKLPLSDMAEALQDINSGREKKDHVLFCVDGVHGLGIEDVTVEDLGCDFLMAGTHKWMFGPRGTGLIWGRRDAWDALDPIIPTFGPSVGVWIGALPPDTPYITPGSVHTPGGFHSFDHRWAVGEAFQFHLDIGKDRIQQRIHGLNTRAKEALASMPHVRMYTPMSPSLSAGIICFDVDEYAPSDVVEHLRSQSIIASTTPYRESYARLAPSLLNNEGEVDRTIDAIAELG
ncbi:aminotransferase [Longibacter salinarum]|uniref:Aminotransferase n=1 Tax=Longibacter salinarum TaxID=1850348 RepID=A0A2A8CV77_9BACT|nr:aminotransferase class V-fold PLP-dependent enzyme [Longibacter salinarum]PEN12510.1 aminotransferase [Longibacter salinarum]